MAAFSRESSLSCVPILLPVLKIYSARNVYYRFSVLAVISEHSLSKRFALIGLYF